MKKYVDHLWFGDGVMQFDTETGAVAHAPCRVWGVSDFGTAWKQNGKWFIFHKDEKSFILQHKTNIWRITPDSEAGIKTYTVLGNFQIRNFRISHGEKPIFSIWYKPKHPFFVLAYDTTYKPVEARNDDFFEYVKNMWDDWAHRPIPDSSIALMSPGDILMHDG